MGLVEAITRLEGWMCEKCFTENASFADVIPFNIGNNKVEKN